MAVLSDSDRRSVWAALMRSLPAPVAATKPQLRACVDSADGWADANLSGFQAAIPEGVRGNSPAHTLLANVAAIARSADVGDVSAGIADRSQSGVLLDAYNSAKAWLSSNAAAYLTALGSDGQTLTTGQAFAVLEAVCRRRAG